MTKPINLGQLLLEMQAAGISVSGLGSDDSGAVYTYDEAGVPAPLPEGAETVIAAHVALRPKTDEEYRTEFATATSTRKQTIRDIMYGLVDREMVPA